MFVGVFVSTTGRHRQFSVAVGVHSTAVASGSPFGSAVLQVLVACYRLVLSGSSGEKCRGLLLPSPLFSACKFLTVCTIRSLNPLLSGYRGELVVGFILLSEQNFLNS